MDVRAQRPFPEDLARHAGFLGRLARRLVADEGLAHDLVQDALVVAVERPPRDRSNLPAWLAGVVRNLFLRGRRAQARRLRREARAAHAEGVAGAADSAARLETQRLLVEAVRALDEPYRSAIVLRYFDGLDAAAIAARLGVPVRTVRTRLRRALGQLRGRMLGRFGDDPRAMCLALLPLALARPAAAGWTGGIVMASKLTVGIGGFVIGAAAATTFTVLARDGTPAARSAPEAPVPRVAAAEARPEPAAPPAASAEAYLERINAAPNGNGARVVASEIAALDPGEARRILLAIYPRIEGRERRQAVLYEFVFDPACPHLLDFVHLAATDPEPALQTWAFQVLGSYAFRDFNGDPSAYAAWRERFRAMPVADVLRQNMAELIPRLEGARGEALVEEARSLGSALRHEDALAAGADLTDLVRDAGGLAMIEEWILRPPVAGEADAEALRSAAFAWLRLVAPDEAWQRRVLLPVVQRPEANPHLGSVAILALGRPGNVWAVEPLLDALRRVPPEAKWRYVSLGTALGRIGDRRAIEPLIDAIAADGTRDTIFGLGHFGLGELTGVPYDPSHDGVWWRKWWEANRHRFGVPH